MSRDSVIDDLFLDQQPSSDIDWGIGTYRVMWSPIETFCFFCLCASLFLRWSSRWNKHLNQYRLMLCINLRNESVTIQSLDSRFYTKNWESIPMYDIPWLWSAIRCLWVSIYVSLFCSLIKKNRDSVKDVYHRGKGGGGKNFVVKLGLIVIFNDRDHIFLWYWIMYSLVKIKLQANLLAPHSLSAPLLTLSP